MSFSDAVGDWTSETEERIDAVHARSVELLGEEMSKTIPEGGNVPFLIGNLARSLLASKSGSVNIKPEGDDGEGNFTGNQSVGLIAATLKAEEPVWLGYQAAYAARVNYGFIGNDSLGRTYNQSGAHFIEAAVAAWPNIVALAVRDVQGASQ